MTYDHVIGEIGAVLLGQRAGPPGAGRYHRV